jgi:nucleotide-binding universal stress UspA family protein
MIRVLLALDESVASFRAAREGVRLFGPDAEFLVISVARMPTPWVPVAGFGVVSLQLPSWDAKELVGLTEADLQQRAADAGTDPAEILTPLGDPVECICAAAEEHDVDAVVVGAHDKGFLTRLFDPSVSAGVVRGTHRPVLVVSGTGPDRPDG